MCRALLCRAACFIGSTELRPTKRARITYLLSLIPSGISGGGALIWLWLFP